MLQRIPYVLTAGLVISLGALGFLNLTTSGLWLDELASVFFAETSHPLWHLFQTRMTQDTSPPLYYIALHYWMLAFTESEFSIRIFSWLIAGLAAILAYIHGRKLLDKEPAFLLAALLFCTPGLIQYGLEARAYALLVLLSSVLILQATALCNEITIKRTLSRNGLLFFVVTGLLAAFTHYSGLFLFAALGLYLLAVASINRVEHGRVWLYGIDSIVIYAFWVFFTYPRIPQHLGDNSGLSFDDNLMSNIYAGLTVAFGNMIIVILLLIPVVVACIKYRRTYMSEHAFIIPVISVLFISFTYWFISLHTPIMTPRNFLVLMPPLLLLSVHATSRILDLRLFAWAGCITCLLLAFFSVERITAIKSEMREAGEYITSLPGCDSGSVFVIPDMGRGEHHFRYYLPNQKLVLISDKKEPFDKFRSEILQQECPAALWIMHWTGRNNEFIQRFGLNPRQLEGIHFRETSVYIRNNALPGPAGVSPDAGHANFSLQTTSLPHRHQ